MKREVFVYVDLEGTPRLAGRLWTRLHKERETATFEYDEIWLAQSGGFSLEPALKLGPGPFHTTPDNRYSAQSEIRRQTGGDEFS